MEFDHVGGRCEISACNRHDYLTYRCDACGRTLCHDHRSYESHSCREGLEKLNRQKAVECPFCLRPFVVGRGEEINQVVSEHIDRGCPQQRREFKRCSMTGCKTRDPVCIRCNRCQKHFCIPHRLERDHSCSSNQTCVDGKRIPTQARGAGNNVTTPLGRPGIAAGDRFSLSVYFPRDSRRQPLHMFFSRNNTVGKVIDDICSLSNFDWASSSSDISASRPALFCVRPQHSVNQLPHLSRISDLQREGWLRDGDRVVLERQDCSAPELMAYVRTEAPPKPAGKKRRACVVM
mmetsp:Transcript_1653/g.4982  ORF Transcript_1653/g.4982 Transcript_1653/m.4982 type:complete len:291 (-) Transcript_1653:146-1018(-)